MKREAQTMSWPDLVNATFEISGCFFVSLSIFTLFKEKQVRGISVFMILFFTSWGYWNLYYYHHLNQLASWIGGIAVTTANSTYLGMIIYYRRKERLSGNQTP
jgi:uncharacterized membrane protein YfcA